MYTTKKNQHKGGEKKEIKQLFEEIITSSTPVSGSFLPVRTPSQCVACVKMGPGAFVQSQAVW